VFQLRAMMAVVRDVRVMPASGRLKYNKYRSTSAGSPRPISTKAKEIHWRGRNFASAITASSRPKGKPMSSASPVS
jgi:hypothetical protein